MSITNETLRRAYEQAVQVIEQVRKVIVNKDTVVAKTLMAILANGHILIDDVPGVGKTTLALAFSRAMSLDCKRLQFTPDVMPSDVVGFTIYNKQNQQFEYKAGAALCNLFLADEINRTSSRTQSALLELMEERKVTVDGVTRELPRPYIVIATQNPIGSVGTQLLPDSQLDRFMICLRMGYPDKAGEINILKGRETGDPLDTVNPVISGRHIVQTQQLIEGIYIDDSVYDYLMALVEASRDNPRLRLGISPRGSLSLMRMAKTSAFLRNRDYVTPNDLQFVFLDTCAHRVVLTAKAKAETDAVTVLSQIMEQVPTPSMKKVPV